MKKTGEAIGDLDGRIWPDSRFSLRKASSSFCSEAASGYTLQLLGDTSAISSMAWSQGLDSGRSSKDSLEKAEWKSRRCGGMCFPWSGGSEFRLKASANRWEIVEDTRIYSGSGKRLVTQIRSPSSSSSST